jgi:hypothetical protein
MLFHSLCMSYCGALCGSAPLSTFVLLALLCCRALLLLPKAKNRRKELRLIQSVGYLGDGQNLTHQMALEDKSTQAEVRTDVVNIQRYKQHRWIKKHSQEADTENNRMEQVRMMRKWFDFLDADGSGEVGLDELEDPLVSVGLARCRKDVTNLIRSVDKTQNGEITFNDFMSIMEENKARRRVMHTSIKHQKMQKHFKAKMWRTQTGLAATHSSNARGVSLSQPPSLHLDDDDENRINPVVKLFDDLTTGKLGDNTLSFPNLITAYRRKMLWNAHMADSPRTKKEGQLVLEVGFSNSPPPLPTHSSSSLPYSP